MKQDFLHVKGANVHNLKNINVSLPKNSFIVFTGLSGSGKSSLAFDTIYAEGQRRYVASLSAYARQFLEQLDKPDVERIDGLSPAISIDQKSASHNPRSTVGTVTEIYDYLRLLFSSIGHPFCYKCGKPIQNQSRQEIVDTVMKWPKDTEITLFAPIVQGKKGEHKGVLEKIEKDGFSRVRVDGEILRINEPLSLHKNKVHHIDIVIDRLSISETESDRLYESIETALKQSNGLVLIQNNKQKKETLFSERLSCTKCNISLGEMSPRLFSFNSPYGACSDCNGLGSSLAFDPDLIIGDPNTPLFTSTQKAINLHNTYYGQSAETVANTNGFSLEEPSKNLTKEQLNGLMHGFGDGWEGIIPILRRRYKSTHSEGRRFALRFFMSEKPCDTCNGQRLKPESLAIKVGGQHISDLTEKSIHDLCLFFEKISLTKKEKTISKQIIKEITSRLSFLQNVGLHYLSLARKASTLSGGEYQRIRLATQIGSGLTGVLYVLDEPSIGLHQRDNQKLLKTLLKLRDLGNTLIVVEHDEETIRMADYLVDIGPQAGRKGGYIVHSGSFKDLLKEKNSITAQYLTQEKSIAVPASRRKAHQKNVLKVVGAAENNLKGINVTFPLGVLVCVTGVSGSGKSSLMNEILHKALHRHFNSSRKRPGKHKRIEGIQHIDKVITIDQSPIGRTPRSNPATYVNIFTPIRELFALTRESKIRGYKAGRFSFNVKGGRCESCEGAGVVKIEMHFLSDVYVTCEVCKGKRYNSQTLDITFKGYTISEILDMTVNEATELFSKIPSVYNKLKTLQDVGLGYIHLGQNATTLSGGEAQRVKLAKELSKHGTGKTLFLLDEPTTGLHFDDIKHLLDVLNRLVEKGNTVVVIEHNLDVIKTADHIIDLGPEGGNGGGTIVAEGTPEHISIQKMSHTGQYLKTILPKYD
ncbi:MAG: excinuclease ABC subunit UvrA [Candidatus Margulisbacteria bacterium]|nr:excinuclease ABC subunit UvrA [Candidatus Margulisiibacteriota bacterium]